MRLAVVVVLSFLVLASAGMAKTIILSQTINVNGSAVNDTNNYVTGVSATNDTGSHTFRFSREGLPNLSVTINDQTGGGSSSGGNMSQWYIDADTGAAFTVLNESLIRILSGTGISTSIVGGDIFIENTGVINEADPLSCHTDGSSCPAFVTYAGLNTILNGQNNLSLLQIKNNLGNYTENPAGYYNSTTLPTWSYNASYVTYTVLNGQANVSPASITGNLTSYATTAALNTGLAGQHNVSPASITGNLSSYATNTEMNTAFAGQSNVSAASITGNLTNYLLSSTFLTVLNGQNNLSLSTIIANIGNWTADKAGYVTSGALTGNLSSYVTNNALTGNLSSYVTNNALTGNLTSYATNAAVLANVTGVNDSWKANVTGYYPRNANPLNYQNTTCTGGNSTHGNVTNGSNCIMVALNPGGGGGISDVNGTSIGAYRLNSSTDVVSTNLTATDRLIVGTTSTADPSEVYVQSTNARMSFNDTDGLTMQFRSQANVFSIQQVGGSSKFAVAFNGTSEHVGILTTAPTSDFTIAGEANVTGALSIGSLKTASCDVKASVNGTLECGTDAGASSWVNVTTLANQNVSGVTLSNITGLEWVASANTNYTFNCNIRYQTNATTSGISFAIEDWGGSVNRLRLSTAIYVVTATAGQWNESNTTGVKAFSTSVNAANKPYFTIMQGIIFNGASAVTITPQFSGEAANLNAAVLRDSYCKVERI